jgi:hypothetical protein
MPISLGLWGFAKVMPTNKIYNAGQPLSSLDAWEFILDSSVGPVAKLPYKYFTVSDVARAASLQIRW